MVNYISVKSELESKGSQNEIFFLSDFYFNGKPLESSESKKHAKWGMTLLKAGSMRFRWNEENQNRRQTLKKILEEIKKPVCSGNCSSSEAKCDCKLKIVPVELIHSKIVVKAETEADTKNLQADGILTKNPLLVPTVTVADCVPIFLYDRETNSFGAFHSGWKGTGIAGEGVKKMAEFFGSKPENICAAIGPHIADCCYFVDEERSEYFSKNFGEACVTKTKHPQSPLEQKFPYRLSLTQANLFVLKKAGIPEENTVVANDCTCCTKFNSGENIFGSYRRQAAFLPGEIDSDTRSRSMTVQAAFVAYC